MGDTAWRRLMRGTSILGEAHRLVGILLTPVSWPLALALWPVAWVLKAMEYRRVLREVAPLVRQELAGQGGKSE